MILEKMTPEKYIDLQKIAAWRDQSLISLRANEETIKGQSQVDWVNSFTDKERYYFIYSVGGPNGLIGYCGLDKINFIHRTAELSLLIDPEKHGKGYGSKAVKELLRIAFEDLNLNCIYIEVIESTTNWDFWEKQGFEYEGVLFNRYFKQNDYQNSMMASIRKDMWRNK